MNATFDGARIHQQELDHEIDSIRAERLINQRAGHRPGPVARGLASVGRGPGQRRDRAREPRRDPGRPVAPTRAAEPRPRRRPRRERP